MAEVRRDETGKPLPLYRDRAEFESYEKAKMEWLSPEKRQPKLESARSMLEKGEITQKNYDTIVSNLK